MQYVCYKGLYKGLVSFPLAYFLRYGSVIVYIELFRTYMLLNMEG
jgi:hypothetical protein